MLLGPDPLCCDMVYINQHASVPISLWQNGNSGSYSWCSSWHPPSCSISSTSARTHSGRYPEGSTRRPSHGACWRSLLQRRRTRPLGDVTTQVASCLVTAIPSKAIYFIAKGVCFVAPHVWSMLCCASLPVVHWSEHISFWTTVSASQGTNNCYIAKQSWLLQNVQCDSGLWYFHAKLIVTEVTNHYNQWNYSCGL
jgi:hypothetical protein